jgi:protein tyrosine phosphatase
MSSKEPGSVSFIDTRMQNGVHTYVIASIVAQHIFQFTTHIYFVMPYTPPHNFYQFKPGTWVDFRGPKDTERPKWHGRVHSVEDSHVLVIEDRMQEEVCE